MTLEERQSTRGDGQGVALHGGGAVCALEHKMGFYTRTQLVTWYICDPITHRQEIIISLLLR